jgi:hypothetical protein
MKGLVSEIASEKKKNAVATMSAGKSSPDEEAKNTKVSSR